MVGESAQACGPLASIAASAGAKFLNLGLDYPDPDHFTIVIWDTSPDWTWDEGQEVCGEGKVSRYEGAPQMQFNNYDDFYYSTSSDAPVDAEFR